MNFDAPTVPKAMASKNTHRMQFIIPFEGMTMNRFHLMSVFAAVAEAESFAGAARRLKMSPPAVTRAVVALEERLGVRLLTRTTRIVRLTEAGARYLEDARRIMSELKKPMPPPQESTRHPRATWPSPHRCCSASCT
jgi:DNA-binding MarR family transcriptional regulator